MLYQYSLNDQTATKGTYLMVKSNERMFTHEIAR